MAKKNDDFEKLKEEVILISQRRKDEGPFAGVKTMEELEKKIKVEMNIYGIPTYDDGKIIALDDDHFRNQEKDANLIIALSGRMMRLQDLEHANVLTKYIFKASEKFLSIVGKKSMTEEEMAYVQVDLAKNVLARSYDEILAGKYKNVSLAKHAAANIDYNAWLKITRSRIIKELEPITHLREEYEIHIENSGGRYDPKLASIVKDHIFVELIEREKRRDMVEVDCRIDKVIERDVQLTDRQKVVTETLTAKVVRYASVSEMVKTAEILLETEFWLKDTRTDALLQAYLNSVAGAHVSIMGSLQKQLPRYANKGEIRRG